MFKKGDEDLHQHDNSFDWTHKHVVACCKPSCRCPAKVPVLRLTQWNPPLQKQSDKNWRSGIHCSLSLSIHYCKSNLPRSDLQMAPKSKRQDAVSLGKSCHHN